MTQVGFGSAQITPQLPVVLAGFGARKGAVHEIHDELEAHAIVIRDGDLTLCLLVLDLLMIGPEVAIPLREEVAAALGTDPINVLPSCTHTHSGPSVTRKAKRIGWPMQDGYLDRLFDGCVRAARMAQAFLEPASFSFGRAALPNGLSMNRRGHAYDPYFQVLDVLRPDGSRIGTIANVAIHPVSLSHTARAVSGDWPTITRAVAGAALDAPVVMMSGAIGDINPAQGPHTDPEPNGNWDVALELGTEVGKAVSQLVGAAQPVGDVARVVAHRTALVRPGLTAAALIGGHAWRRQSVELVEWELGDIRVVSMPGEIFHELGARIEQARDHRALLAGLSPWWQGYLPCPFTKGYEESMSYGRRFVREVGDLLAARPDR